MDIKPTVTWEDFEKLDIRSGTIISAEDFPGLRNPAYKLTIDFGEIGVRKSSAQVTDFYTVEDLIGMQIVAVVNFPPKQIKNFFSECLVLGLYSDNKEVTLLKPSLDVENGKIVG